MSAQLLVKVYGMLRISQRAQDACPTHFEKNNFYSQFLTNFFHFAS